MRIWKAREDRNMEKMVEEKAIVDYGNEIDKVLTPADYINILATSGGESSDEITNAIEQLTNHFNSIADELQSTTESYNSLQSDFEELMNDYNNAENELSNFRKTIETMPPNEPEVEEPISTPSIDEATAPSYLDSLLERED